MLLRLLYSFKNREPPKKVRRILFFKLGAIGDILMTTPLVRAVRLRYPDARIDYFCGRPYMGIIKGNKHIAEVIPFDPEIFAKRRVLEAIKLRGRIAGRGYDVAFVLDKHWAMSVFASFCRTGFRIGFDRNGEGYANNYAVPYGEEKHEINYYLELGHGLGIESIDTDMDLLIDKKSERFAQDVLKKSRISRFICIAPGGANNPGVSDDPIRRWPVEKYIDLIRRLDKFTIVLVGGRTDSGIADKIAITDKRILNLAGKTSLIESAAVMKLANWIICCDSGPMHIAAAVNKKVISLFGPTNPRRKAPLHKESVAIWKDHARYESDYEVFGKRPEGEFMQDILPEDILRLIR